METPELKHLMQQQMDERQPLFGPLLTTPEGANFTQDEFTGVPVEITEPANGVSNTGRVLLYLHGGGYSNGLAASARSVGVAVRITEHPDAENIWILNGPW